MASTAPHGIEEREVGPAKRVKVDSKLQDFCAWLEKHGANWSKLSFEEIEGKFTAVAM